MVIDKMWNGHSQIKTYTRFIKAIRNIAFVLLLTIYGLAHGHSQESKNDIKEILDRIESNMIKVEGGKFLMGDSNVIDDSSGYTRVHMVSLYGFSIGRYEVTQGEWQAIMGTTVREQRDLMMPTDSIVGEGSNFPMYYISCEEALEFIRRLNQMTGKNYRLPTESEWEYAAIGGKLSKGYKYAGSDSLGEVGWFVDNSTGRTHEVGSKRANELGLFDMSGNVSEWCSDWFAPYPEIFTLNPKGPDRGDFQILRGGSWKDSLLEAGVRYRSGFEPEFGYEYVGFRLVSN